jgi:hypothetical protein
MQKWEYCVVGPIIKNFGGSDFAGYYPYLAVLTNQGPQTRAIFGESGMSENDHLANTIAQLGEAGWEMIGCGSTGGKYVTSHLLYFKRPKE